jgi:hypothetical protein
VTRSRNQNAKSRNGNQVVSNYWFYFFEQSLGKQGAGKDQGKMRIIPPPFIFRGFRTRQSCCLPVLSSLQLPCWACHYCRQLVVYPNKCLVTYFFQPRPVRCVLFSWGGGGWSGWRRASRLVSSSPRPPSLYASRYCSRSRGRAFFLVSRTPATAVKWMVWFSPSFSAQARLIPSGVLDHADLQLDRLAGKGGWASRAFRLDASMRAGVLFFFFLPTCAMR